MCPPRSGQFVCYHVSSQRCSHLKTCDLAEFKAVGIKEPPAMLRQVQDNKMFVLGSLWFLNNYGNSQLSTGAFEIMLDDEVIFSKLESKRVPTAEEVLNILREAGFN